MKLQEYEIQFNYFPPSNGDCLDTLISRTGCSASTYTFQSPAEVFRFTSSIATSKIQPWHLLIILLRAGNINTKMKSKWYVL